MKISDILKLEIEKYATRMLAHPLLTLARRGQVSPEIATSYLANARFLVQNTPRHLEMARRRSLELARPELARHFAHKMQEETGHDRWADADLGKLRDLFGSRPVAEPTRALRELVAYLDRIIAEEPARYLAYVLEVEYFTVLTGPEWVRALDERCGVPREALTVVTHHVELDQEHVLEGLHEIDALVSDSALFSGLTQTAFDAMALLERFFDELYQQASQQPLALRDAS